jgi:hypothetical protein
MTLARIRSRLVPAGYPGIGTSESFAQKTVIISHSNEERSHAKRANVYSATPKLEATGNRI